MMFNAMIKKEFLLVLRDKHALLALFVMPAIFIVIMSVAMRDQFSTKKIEFSLYIKDGVKTEMTKAIIKDVNADKNFVLLESKEDAEFVVRLPKRYEKNSRKKVKISVQDSIKSDKIEAFKAMLSEHILRARFDVMADNVKEHSYKAAKSLKELEISTDSLFKVKYNGSKTIPNSTQQSVPAWIVFGMFFIIIPMSTIFINERKQNTLMRMQAMNISIPILFIGKIVPYMLINQIQVWLMIGVGIFIVPLLGADALTLGDSLAALFMVSTGLSLAAIGTSIIIAVSVNTVEQATTIGGISNILFGAIGGVMVPKMYMPQGMQTFSNISPMSWGLEGFLDIFLRGGGLREVIPESLALCAFGLALLMLAAIIFKRRMSV